MCFALFAQFAQAVLLDGITIKTAIGKVCNECKTLGELVNWD